MANADQAEFVAMSRTVRIVVRQSEWDDGRADDCVMTASKSDHGGKMCMLRVRTDRNPISRRDHTIGSE
jgi:hypothetical protein